MATELALGRTRSPALALFLASDEASFVNGAEPFVYGG